MVCNLFAVGVVTLPVLLPLPLTEWQIVEKQLPDPIGNPRSKH
ncbi:hypothetical protein ALP99_01410 [Pseudomonas syringae pv. tomato]|jgi:hypothetical protein|uniref:Uncharacterized protein n=11 Tax=Pseudomonas syringae group TaxID=136849 RepID=A0A0Q0GJD4_PSESX|nr:Unknown protein sequence [Pseudomonas syringae pv. maculicola]KPW31861.1 Unknown protein sequence [Pseudomonas syringae pv. apii]KPW46997.1 Unknown protein sequence [Pseudomonas syringae pv. antirrhini]KPW51824.1 hypothetical protein ALO86_200031 [Pseudomonas syringae pv. berberidis]KPX16451.1 hypothetical protein ALO72_101202 [Pseudomonas syringae pv. delphinii]KPY23857.1 hypothetical protein ALO54_200024 [Pseudomonas syringae pv. philadelphi]KPY77003.1 Unknown protein sequence [Pseudomon